MTVRWFIVLIWSPKMFQECGYAQTGCLPHSWTRRGEYLNEALPCSPACSPQHRRERQTPECWFSARCCAWSSSAAEEAILPLWGTSGKWYLMYPHCHSVDFLLSGSDHVLALPLLGASLSQKSW